MFAAFVRTAADVATRLREPERLWACAPRRPVSRGTARTARAPQPAVGSVSRRPTRKQTSPGARVTGSPGAAGQPGRLARGQERAALQRQPAASGAGGAGNSPAFPGVSPVRYGCSRVRPPSRETCPPGRAPTAFGEGSSARLLSLQSEMVYQRSEKGNVRHRKMRPGRGGGAAAPGMRRAADTSGHCPGRSPGGREGRGFLLPSSCSLVFCECHQGGCGFLVFLHDLSNLNWPAHKKTFKVVSSSSAFNF